MDKSTYLATLADDARACLRCLLEAHPELSADRFLTIAGERLDAYEQATLDILPAHRRQAK